MHIILFESPHQGPHALYLVQTLAARLSISSSLKIPLFTYCSFNRRMQAKGHDCMHTSGPVEGVKYWGAKDFCVMLVLQFQNIGGAKLYFFPYFKKY